MTNAPEKDSAKSTLILAAALILVAVFMLKFGLQTLVWFEAKRWTSASPWLAETPKALDASLAADAPAPQAKAAPKTQLRAYECEFLPPWPGNYKLVPASSFSQFRFESGQIIVLFDPSAEVDTIGALRAANSPPYQRLEDPAGGAPIDSNYALYSAAYGASPSQTSPFQNAAVAFRLEQLLLLKLEFGSEMQPGLSSLSAGKNRGLEFGDPASGRAVLRLFDDSANQYRLVFLVQAESNARITQDDINVVAGSFQPVPLLER